MIQAQVEPLTICRVCSAPHPRQFLLLKNMPLADEFVRPDTKGSEFTGDIAIFWCEHCKVVQTQHNVDLSEYYLEDYTYTASRSPFARRFMSELAAVTVQRFGLEPGCKVIEIGSGDGCQLRNFRDIGSRVLGYEPSAPLAQESRALGVDVVECLFTPETTKDIPESMRPADVVLLTYTLDHLPDPRCFLERVRSILDKQRGLLVIEVHDLSRIIERCEACLFQHEHSVYLSTITMMELLSQAGFRLVTDNLIPESHRRGNSLLVVATPAGSGIHSEPKRRSILTKHLQEWPAYASFGDDVKRAIHRLVRHVRSGKKNGKRFAGYGAGGRATMMMAMADLTSTDIDYVCDSNPSVHGLISPRSHVPVVSPTRLLDDPVDEVIVFPFGYFDEIRTQNSQFEERGGRFVSLLDLMTNEI